MSFSIASETVKDGFSETSKNSPLIKTQKASEIGQSLLQEFQPTKIDEFHKTLSQYTYEQLGELRSVARSLYNSNFLKLFNIFVGEVLQLDLSIMGLKPPSDQIDEIISPPKECVKNDYENYKFQGKSLINVLFTMKEQESTLLKIKNLNQTEKDKIINYKKTLLSSPLEKQVHKTILTLKRQSYEPLYQAHYKYVEENVLRIFGDGSVPYFFNTLPQFPTKKQVSHLTPIDEVNLYIDFYLRMVIIRVCIEYLVDSKISFKPPYKAKSIEKERDLYLEKSNSFQEQSLEKDVSWMETTTKKKNKKKSPLKKSDNKKDEKETDESSASKTESEDVIDSSEKDNKEEEAGEENIFQDNSTTEDEETMSPSFSPTSSPEKQTLKGLSKNEKKRLKKKQGREQTQTSFKIKALKSKIDDLKAQHNTSYQEASELYSAHIKQKEELETYKKMYENFKNGQAKLLSENLLLNQKITKLEQEPTVQVPPVTVTSEDLSPKNATTELSKKEKKKSKKEQLKNQNGIQKKVEHRKSEEVPVLDNTLSLQPPLKPQEFLFPPNGNGEFHDKVTTLESELETLSTQCKKLNQQVCSLIGENMQQRIEIASYQRLSKQLSDGNILLLLEKETLDKRIAVYKQKK